MRPTQRWLLAVPLLFAAALVARLLLVWAARFTYPFDLEWMEGGMLLHALRLSRDLPLYTEPGREFIPYIYPPGYPSVVAALGTVTGGVDYPAARLVSLAGVAAAAAAIVRLVRDDGGAIAWGLLGAAFFLGSYEDSGAFFDIVRPDGLLIGLVAWSLALGLDRRKGALEASALLLAAAYLVKHNAAALGLPLALGIGLRDGWKEAARFAAWSALPALAATGILQATTGGLFLTYVVGVPGSHELRGQRIFPGLPNEVFRTLPVASGVAIAWVVDRFRHPASWRAWYGLGVGVVVVVVTALMRGHTGGFVNVLIPLHWTLAAGAAVGLSRYDRQNARWLPALALLATVQVAWHTAEMWRWHDEPREADPAATGWRAIVAADPLVPTARDVEAGQAVVEALRGLPEPLWSPFAPWVAVQAGHLDPGPPLIALWDVDRDRGPLQRGAVDVRKAIEEGWYATIVDGTRGAGYGTDEHYARAKHLGVPRGAFDPRTGWRARPEEILVPKSERPPRLLVPREKRPLMIP